MNYLGKMRGYPQLSFWISMTLVKIYISCIIINRGKNTFELVGTVLNKTCNWQGALARVAAQLLNREKRQGDVIQLGLISVSVHF